jgi:hypothetical protein
MGSLLVRHLKLKRGAIFKDLRGLTEEVEGALKEDFEVV